MEININMDINILFSVINTKLRNDYNSLEGLCEDYQLNKEALTKKMLNAGFEYNPSNNQFTTK